MCHCSLKNTVHSCQYNNQNTNINDTDEFEETHVDGWVKNCTLKYNYLSRIIEQPIFNAYSPVFLAMLKAGMAESVNEQVVITDIEVDIMEKVIEFMYTGVIDPIPGFNDLEEIV
ncbi:hypothetical protein PV328_010462 [Microctonus aethiopoides]|uniref:BTB domain-containing protein n=1 Tax=Microctonus aethiopoides TaxID=144406 RepID=A0AA39KQA8_9HYME|nr:hypothetical protein PV328_010462 [Microctonus aethiopoides]